MSRICGDSDSMNRNRQMRVRGVFKNMIPESPNEGACLRCMIPESPNDGAYDESESPNDAACLEYMASPI